MVDETIVAIQSVLLFGVGMGITFGSLFGFCVLLFKHRRSGGYRIPD